MAIAINTLAYARKLREAGFSEQQAEGQAEALAAAMTDTLATKQDLDVIRERIQSLERHMDTRFVAQDARMDAKLADLERRMTMRLGGITVTGIGVVSALVRIL
jgi:prephenate dehydratase